MGRRFSGNAGSVGAAAMRAVAVSQQVPIQSGSVFTLAKPNLLAPIAFSKTGGNANLTINATTGAIAAGSALAAGASQSINGAIAGADGVTIPFAVTLTGLSGGAGLPAAPTLSAAAGTGAVTLSWTDGATGGSAITAHTLYRGTTAGGEAPIATITGASPYTDSGLTNGTTYYYRLSATNGGGEGAASGEVSAQPAAAAAAPAAPTMTLTAAAGQVSVGWTDGAANGAAITAHKLYRGTSAGGETLVATLSGASPYADTGLTNGQAYYYRLTAVNGQGEGAPSAEASAMPASVPAAPTMTLSAASTQVSIGWTDGATGGAAITAHKLYRGTSAGGEALIATITGAAPYVDGGLTNGQAYYYKLSAVNAQGESALGAEANATPSVGAVPAAPTMTLTPGVGRVTIAWTDGATGGSAITAHTLYRGTSAGGEVAVATITAGSPYVDGGLTNGTRYYYRLSATNAAGEGAAATEASAVPATVPAAPAITLTAGAGQATIAWTDGATGGSAITAHKLYRGTAAGAEALVATITANSPYLDTGLSNGQAYFYTLSAVNAQGEGAASAEASVTPATVPAAPTMTLTAATGKVTIGWTDGANGGAAITAHKLYRGSATGGETLLGTITSASPYVDSGLASSTTYYYRLSAVNAVGEGAQAAEQSATTPAAAPSVITPPNWDMIGYGDSRTENAVAGSLTSGGYTATSNNLGPVAWVPMATGHRLRLARYPNYGVSASTAVQGAQVPRWAAASTAPTNSSPQTWFRGADSQNKGADYAANSGAGVVVMLYGTNDADADKAGNTRTAITTILNNLASTQLKVLFNECPRGLTVKGVSQNGPTSQAMKDYSAWLSSLDYASGSPNARSDVIVVDLFTDAYDTAGGANKQGYLRDGLHFTPYGARRAASLVHDRLTAVYGSAYTGLPAKTVLPVSSGASIAADAVGAHAPFVHTNPLLTPGTNGTVQGTAWASGPTAATVPQGWIIVGSGTSAGITVSSDKTGTDPDGYPMWTVTVSGTLADQAVYTLGMSQTAQASGQTVAVTDKLRAIARVKTASGSQQLEATRVRLTVQDATATKTQAAIALGGSYGAGTDRDGYYINSQGYDAGGSSDVIMTQLLDLADPNMNTANGGPGVVASISNVSINIEALFANFTGATQNVSATISISRAGVFKASN